MKFFSFKVRLDMANHTLRELFSKNDGAYQLKFATEVQELKIIVLDYNRSTCTEAKVFKSDLISHPNLFALFRLYYVSLAKQVVLNWEDFVQVVVVVLVREGFTSSLEEFMRQQIN